MSNGGDRQDQAKELAYWKDSFWGRGRPIVPVVRPRPETLGPSIHVRRI